MSKLLMGRNWSIHRVVSLANKKYGGVQLLHREQQA
jgi:hypothetical protein